MGCDYVVGGGFQQGFCCLMLIYFRRGRNVVWQLLTLILVWDFVTRNSFMKIIVEALLAKCYRVNNGICVCVF